MKTLWPISKTLTPIFPEIPTAILPEPNWFFHIVLFMKTLRPISPISNKHNEGPQLGSEILL